MRRHGWISPSCQMTKILMVVEARAMLLQKLQNQTKSDSPKLVDV